MLDSSAKATPRELFAGERVSRWPHPELLAVGAPAALAALLCLFHLGSYGLWEPDEARYAEIAREMLLSRDFVLPHLNYVLYVEKPPLLYWLTSLSFAIFGENEFAARFFVALFAVAGVAATAYFALRTFDPRRATLAGAVLATMPLYAVMGQVLTTDMMLATLVTIASFALFLQWRDGGRWCWLAYLAIALGVLTKGPVGAALPLLTLGVFLLWQRDLASLRRFHLIAGLAMVLAIATPWFVMMIARVPGYFDFYFVGEHLRRAFESSYSHGEPFWFYAPVLLLGLLPWSMLVPLFTWRALAPNPARRFCLASAEVTIVAFSLASAKLIPYILPALAPLAVLIADGVATCVWPHQGAESRTTLRPPDTRIFAEAGPLLALLGAAALVTGARADRFSSPYPALARPALYGIGVVMLAGGAATLLAALRGRMSLALGALVLTLGGALLAGSFARLETEPLRSYAALGQTIAARAPGATVI
ncbi:MAG TPA: glycosyltransferase family 39 protein [Candidatus Binataceae bacterium]|nr:glycosyltransferase family 39 protein [Candidatus Binataceae bacterium]